MLREKRIRSLFDHPEQNGYISEAFQQTKGEPDE
jgi:hypothetical protein